MFTKNVSVSVVKASRLVMFLITRIVQSAIFSLSPDAPNHGALFFQKRSGRLARRSRKIMTGKSALDVWRGHKSYQTQSFHPRHGLYFLLTKKNIARKMTGNFGFFVHISFANFPEIPKNHRANERAPGVRHIRAWVVQTEQKTRCGCQVAAIVRGSTCKNNITIYYTHRYLQPVPRQ